MPDPIRGPHKNFGKNFDSTLDRGVNHILAIAIDEYPYQKPLNNCVRDVEAIIAVLTERYNFDPANVKKLYNQQATFEGIIAAIDSYSNQVLSEKDSLIILFSGHGQNRNNIGFWVPYEAERHTQFLPHSTIRDYLEPILARHVFLICDSCFAGRFFKTNTRSALKVQPEERIPSRYALTSGRNEVNDGTPGQNSPFAANLIRVLRNASQPLGVIMLSEQIKQDVARAEEQSQEPVHGILNVGPFEDLGQFYFLPKEILNAGSGDEGDPLNPAVVTLREIEDWYGKNTILRKQSVDNSINRYFPDAPYTKEAFERIVASLKEGPLKNQLKG